MGRLDELDLTKSLSRKEEARDLDRAWERLTQLRLTLGGLIGARQLGPPVCVVFEGWDASGKGGAIKRLVAQMDPRHVRVVQFSAPSSNERRHRPCRHERIRRGTFRRNCGHHRRARHLHGQPR